MPIRRRLVERPASFRALCALGRDRRGATVIEFAFVAAPLVALLLAIVETSLVYFAQQGLETTAEAAGRLIMTGQAQSAGWSQSQFQTQACAALPSYMSCSQLMVDVQSSTTYGAATTGAPTITYDKNGAVTNAWQYSVGTAGSIVVVRLMYIWPVPTGPLGFNLGTTSNGRRLLLATSIAKTEPYST